MCLQRGRSFQDRENPVNSLMVGAETRGFLCGQVIDLFEVHLALGQLVAQGQVRVLPAIDYAMSLVGAGFCLVALKTVNDGIDILVTHLIKEIGGLGATAV